MRESQLDSQTFPWYLTNIGVVLWPALLNHVPTFSFKKFTRGSQEVHPFGWQS